jgi:hypothetical protein
VIHEDHVRPRLREVLDGQFRGLGGIYLDLILLEDPRQKTAGGTGIVDDEGALGRHARYPIGP